MKKKKNHREKRSKKIKYYPEKGKSRTDPNLYQSFFKYSSVKTLLKQKQERIITMLKKLKKILPLCLL
ncbi:hypothetical protein ACFLQL_03860, partial [Verrucomicrobiota bacterium]